MASCLYLSFSAASSSASLCFSAASASALASAAFYAFLFSCSLSRAFAAAAATAVLTPAATVLLKLYFFLEIADPGVIEDLNERQSFGGIVLEDRVHEVSVLRRQPWLEPYGSSHDLFLDLAWMHSRERCPAVHQLVQKNTQRPNIQRVVVCLVLYHFWRHVFQCSAEGIPLLVRV